MSNIQLYSVPLPRFAARARSAIDQELVLLPRLRANNTVTATATTTNTITATMITAKSTFVEMRSQVCHTGVDQHRPNNRRIKHQSVSITKIHFALQAKHYEDRPFSKPPGGAIEFRNLK